MNRGHESRNDGSMMNALLSAHCSDRYEVDGLFQGYFCDQAWTKVPQGSTS